MGRLDQQKGVHLVHHAIYYALYRQAQFVLLGSATETAINNWFLHEKNHLNHNPDCHIEIGFNEELSHLIYAGADIIIVPSNYEPCGLTQMIGLQYGTVPVVRGLAGYSIQCLTETMTTVMKKKNAMVMCFSKLIVRH
ncbi:hypothetical protein APLC1_0322 [Limnospira platensis C1]|nr:hypothetical protein APLC1_0322 [Arthrospira platensis C1]